MSATYPDRPFTLGAFFERMADADFSLVTPRQEREHPVRCTDCRRADTWAVSGLCAECAGGAA